MPGADSSSIRGVCSVRIDQRVAALLVRDGGLVGEADTDGLGKKQHVGDFVPGIRVPLGLEVFGYIARAQFCRQVMVGGDMLGTAWHRTLKEPDQGIGARTAVEPKGQLCLR